jgi:hypothetical protein
VAPTQITALDGVIGVGSVNTVTTVLAVQPVGKVNVMVSEPPAGFTPVTIPVDPTVAIEVLLLDHVPAPDSPKVVVAPGHTVLMPYMPLASGFTVTVVLIVHPPGAV